MEIGFFIWNIRSIEQQSSLGGMRYSNRSFQFLDEYLAENEDVKVVGLVECPDLKKLPGGYFKTFFDPADRNSDSAKEFLADRLGGLYPNFRFHKGLRLFVRRNSSITASLIGTSIDGRALCYRVHTPETNTEFSIILAHLTSKRDFKRVENHYEVVSKQIDDILHLERSLNLSNNLMLAGDLNLSPYEYPLLHHRVGSLPGLNAIASSKLVQQTANEHNVQYWYNPMWRFLADYDPQGTTPNPTMGTYSYAYGTSPVNNSSSWNIYDQVIFRKGLISKLKHESLKIVTSSSRKHLMSGGRVCSELYSDHLPIHFQLKF